MAKGRQQSDSEKTELDPAQSYRSAMKQLIGERWGAVWLAVPIAIAGEDTKGVHDVRVASRRLRAAMDVAAECFPEGWYRPLHGVAKEITGALGEVRDRDVLIEHLTAERERAAAGDQPGIDRLITRVSRERDIARTAMEAFLNGLQERQIATETVKRFGAAAAWPDAPA